MSVSLETRYLEGFVRAHEWDALQEQVSAAMRRFTAAPDWATIFWAG